MFRRVLRTMYIHDDYCKRDLQQNKRLNLKRFITSVTLATVQPITVQQRQFILKFELMEQYAIWQPNPAVKSEK